MRATRFRVTRIIVFVTSVLLALGVSLTVAPAVSSESYRGTGAGGSVEIVKYGQPQDPSPRPPVGGPGANSSEDTESRPKEDGSSGIEEAPKPGEPNTSGVQDWILGNIIPLIFLAVALLLLWLGGGKGDNAGVMRRLGGVIVALAVIGIAVTGGGVSIGSWLASLFAK